MNQKHVCLFDVQCVCVSHTQALQSEVEELQMIVLFL